MRYSIKTIMIAFLLFPLSLLAEKAVLNGTIFEEKGNTSLDEAKITIIDASSKVVISNLYTNDKGEFSCELEQGKSYRIKVERENYQSLEEVILVKDKEVKKKLKLKKKRNMSGRIAAQRFTNPPNLHLASMLLPYLLKQHRDSLPEYWWKTKEEKQSSKGSTEAFQEDIFINDNITRKGRSSYGNPSTSTRRGNNWRRSTETARGVPSRRRGNSSNLDIPDSFDQNAGPNPTSKIIPETEVTAKKLIQEVQLMDNNYTGFMVQIILSGKALTEDHEIFQRHGNIILENNGGEYAYLLGKFEEQEDAEKFMEEALVITYPEAKVIQYRFGRRISE